MSHHRPHRPPPDDSSAQGQVFINQQLIRVHGLQVPFDIDQPVFNDTRQERDSGSLSAAHRAAYQAWIRRTEGNRTGEDFCEAASYFVADVSVSYENFYSKTGLLDAAFREARERAHYEAALRHTYDAFAQPQLAQVRLSMRELRGDHVLVEQFLLVDLGVLFSQLGGFIGLFIGGSVISILHLGSFTLEAAMQRYNYRRKLAQLRTPKKATLMVALLLAALVTGICLAVVLTKQQQTKPAAEKSPRHFNRSSFFSFPTASSDQLHLQGCGENYLVVRPDWLSSTKAVMTSPGFPRKYPEDRICPYTIVARPFSLPIRLSFTQFDVEAKYDRLSFLSGTGEGSTRKDCSGVGAAGLQCAFEMVPRGKNLLKLEFASDATDTLQGFRAEASLDHSSCTAMKEAENKRKQDCTSDDQVCLHTWQKQKKPEGAGGYSGCEYQARSEPNSMVLSEKLCIGRVEIPASVAEGLSWEKAFCACANRGGTLAAPVPSLNFTQEVFANFIIQVRKAYENVRNDIWLGGSRAMEFESREATSWLFGWHSFDGEIQNGLPVVLDKAHSADDRNCLKFVGSEGSENLLLASGCGAGVRITGATYPICMYLRSAADPGPFYAPVMDMSGQITWNDYAWRLPEEPLPASACGPQQPGSIRIPLDSVHDLYAVDMNCTWSLSPESHPSAILRLMFNLVDLEPHYDAVELRNDSGHRVLLCTQSQLCPDFEGLGPHSVHFTSDRSVVAGGFRLTYSWTEYPGGEVVERMDGVLPGFPDAWAQSLEYEQLGVPVLVSRTDVSPEQCAAWCAHDERCTVASVAEAEGSGQCRLQSIPQALAVLGAADLLPGLSLLLTKQLRTVRGARGADLSRDCAAAAEGSPTVYYGFDAESGNEIIRHGDTCYAMVAAASGWDSAQYYCQANFGDAGMALMDPSDAAEWDSLVRFLTPSGYRGPEHASPNETWPTEDPMGYMVPDGERFVWLPGFRGRDGWLWLRSANIDQALEWDGRMGKGSSEAVGKTEAGGCASLRVRRGHARLRAHPQRDCIASQSNGSTLAVVKTPICAWSVKEERRLAEMERDSEANPGGDGEYWDTRTNLSDSSICGWLRRLAMSSVLRTDVIVENYSGGLRCEWHITGEAGRDLQFRFYEFNTVLARDVFRLYDGRHKLRCSGPGGCAALGAGQEVRTNSSSVYASFTAETGNVFEAPGCAQHNSSPADSSDPFCGFWLHIELI